MDNKKFYHWKENSLILELQIQAKSSKNSILGKYNGRLKISITTSPTKGKANNHLIELLAEYFSVPKSKIEIIKGLQNKLKTVAIANPKKNLDNFT